MRKPAIIVDIETIAHPRAPEWQEPIEAPANYKDPDKIAEYIATKSAEQDKKNATNPWLCKIIAIGIQA